jgi:hypothetical protein
MPLLVWALVIGASAVSGAYVWNKVDDTLIDPFTGASQPRPLIAPGPVVAAALGAGLALYARKRGLI